MPPTRAQRERHRRHRATFRPGQPRDLIGHWVAPANRRQHPCPHSCCAGKRVHPDNLPVRLDRKYLRGLTDEEVGAELQRYSGYADTHERGYLEILAEAGRREDAGRGEAVERGYSRQLADEAEATRISERLAANRVERGKRREQEWRDEVYRQWLHAENATRGVMLNKAGQRADVDERTLFTGPESRVRKYASPELIEWFESHPRPTRASFLGSVRERRAHLEGRRIG